MANVRIIYNDMTATTSSITVGGVAATGLRTNTKSLAHRSSTTSVTYSLTWASGRTINGIVLPATNLSSSATITVTANGATVINNQAACANTTLDAYIGVKNSNSFPYGGLSKVAKWWGPTNTTNITSLSITLTDTSKTSNATAIATGYPYDAWIDCSRIVCGQYWEPSLGASKDGLSIDILDTTQTSRTDAGDLIADRGTIHDQLRFNLGILSKADREELVKLLKNVGTYTNIAVSIFPGTNDRDEQDYLIYGKRETSPIDYLVHNYYSHSFSIIGW